MATEATETAVERCEVKEGEIVSREDARWPSFVPEVGDLLEVKVISESGEEAEARVAILVTGAKDKDLVEGRYLGSSNEDIAKHCVNKINRQGLPIHFCREDPCEHRSPEVSRACYPTSMVAAGKVSRAVPEELGYPSPEGMDGEGNYQEEEKDSGARDPKGRPCEEERTWKRSEDPLSGKAQGGSTTKEREAFDWKRKRKWRPRWRQRHVETWPIERAISWTSREASKAWEARRSGCYRCRGLGGWTGVWRRLRLCGGPSGQDGVSRRSYGSQYLSPCSGKRCEARGYKRWYLEREGTRSEESESEEEEKEGSRSVEPVAASCGVATEEKGGREEKERKEKQELRIQRGKGVGEAVRRKEEKAEEGRGQPGSFRERLERVRRERRRQFELRLPDVGPFAEEEFEAAGGSAENVDSARPPNAGSDCSAGGGRFRGDHKWSEDGHLLQPVDPTLPCSNQPRYERAALPLDLHGRVESWEAGSLGGQPSLPVSGSSQCSERRWVEDGSTLGAPPVGRSTVGSYAVTSPSPSSFEAGGKKSGKGRKRERLEEVRRQRLVERRVAGCQGKERRKRKGQRPWERRLRQAGQLARMAKRSWRQRKLVGEEQRKGRKGREQGEERRQVTEGHLSKMNTRYNRGEEASENRGKAEENKERKYERGEEASHKGGLLGLRSITEMRGEESCSFHMHQYRIELKAKANRTNTPENVDQLITARSPLRDDTHTYIRICKMHQPRATFLQVGSSHRKSNWRCQ